jgi:hypothetical protein
MAMDHQSRKRKVSTFEPQTDGKFDFDALLHPARAFANPMDVVRDPDLTLNEKRAILASWASDACAVEAAPELRQLAKGPPVRFDDIMIALKSLDADAAKSTNYAKLMNRARRIKDLFRKDGEGGIFIN